jgi:EF-hand domain/EF hand
MSTLKNDGKGCLRARPVTNRTQHGGRVWKEIPMKNPILMLTACTFILGCGALAAYAQQGPETSMLQQAQKQSGDEEGADGPGMKRDDMMGHRMMRHDGMMGCDMMGRSRGVMGGPFAMRIIFALMEGDGDGTISLEEFQAAHARIFKAMDADKDGTLTLEEMQSFLRGAGKGPPER